MAGSTDSEEIKLNKLIELFNSNSDNKEAFVRKAFDDGLVTDKKIARDFFDTLKKSRGMGTTYTGAGANNNPESVGGTSLPTMLENFLSAMETRDMYGIDEKKNVKDYFQIAINSQGKLNKLSEIGSNFMKNIGDEILTYTKQQSALQVQINEKAGLTGKYSEQFRNALTDANPRLLQLGISFDDLVDASQRLIRDTGRFATINQQTWERAGEVAKSYVGDLDELVSMIPEFQKIGFGFSDANEKIAAAGKAALSVGLQAQKITSELRTNLSKLNEYGFKNGVDGLSTMLRKANEFRISMESVYAIADKVMNPEGALELSANLQVLGGAIGDFNDPLKLMYMATNNVEGLQDALIGASSSLATYNDEQGRFEITGINLRRAKEMSQQLGVSMGELTKGAIAAAERTRAAQDLASRGVTISDDQKEFITNIAQMKDGKMVIELGSSEKLQKMFGATTVAIDELTSDQIKVLTDMQDEFKKKTEEEIIRDQATSVMNIERDLDFMVALLRKTGGKSVEAIYQETLGKAGFSMKNASDATLNISKEFRASLEGKEFKNKEAFQKLLNDVSEKAKKEVTGQQGTPPPPTKTPTVTPPVTKSESPSDGAAAAATTAANKTAQNLDGTVEYRNSSLAALQNTATNTAGLKDAYDKNTKELMAKLGTTTPALASTTPANIPPVTNTTTTNNYSNITNNYNNYVNNTALKSPITDASQAMYSFASLKTEPPKTTPNSAVTDNSALLSAIQTGIQELITNKNKPTETKESPERPLETTKLLKIEINSTNTVVDAVARALLNDPEFLGSIKKGAREYVATT